ncbi:hypothetical protein GLA29479_996 [Lysobacter antibioticus]|nr:hypothetical protein GLA29479_996 [Lysobacter antibioticus]
MPAKALEVNGIVALRRVQSAGASLCVAWDLLLLDRYGAKP